MRSARSSWLGACLACAWACACTQAGEADPVDATSLLHAPGPIDNPFTPEKAELGRHLFYDVRLSLHENIACASCHRQELAWSDGRARSRGTTGQLTPRNAQSLVNAAYAATLTHANFVLTTLERQVLVPLFGEDPVEMGMAGRDALLLSRLRAEPRYPPLFAAAFPDAREPIRLDHVVYALASFERTLVSARSDYDRYRAGDARALDAAAQRGLELFRGERLGCSGCHDGELFSSAFARPGPDHQPAAPRFEHNGLYADYPDGNAGLYDLTGREDDRGRFRPPSLRNVNVTAPYMHDGSIATLEDVLEHYAHAAEQSPRLRAFELDASARAALLAFFDSLTDYELLEDPRLSDPW